MQDGLESLAPIFLLWGGPLSIWLLHFAPLGCSQPEDRHRKCTGGGSRETDSYCEDSGFSLTHTLCAWDYHILSTTIAINTTRSVITSSSSSSTSLHFHVISFLFPPYNLLLLTLQQCNIRLTHWHFIASLHWTLHCILDVSLFWWFNTCLNYRCRRRRWRTSINRISTDWLDNSALDTTVQIIALTGLRISPPSDCPFHRTRTILALDFFAFHLLHFLTKKI